MPITLIALDEWITTIQEGGSKTMPNRTAAKAMLNPGFDVIETIATSLVEHAAGIERDLLSKSLQETLLSCAGFDTDIDYQQIESRLARFLARRGKGSLIQRFLSLYFFNSVWFETGESFRALAPTSASFENDMDEVDKMCQRVVASTWKSHQLKTRPLDMSAAQELVQNIEEQLRGA